MSLRIATRFGRPLALASVALVIRIGTAVAADSPSDIQQHMKAILAGTSANHPALQAGPVEGNVTTRSADAQELVKQLLLGKTSSSRGAAASIKHSEAAAALDKAQPQEHPRAYGDMQAAVQHGLLGQHHASDAS